MRVILMLVLLIDLRASGQDHFSQVAEIVVFVLQAPSIASKGLRYVSKRVVEHLQKAAVAAFDAIELPVVCCRRVFPKEKSVKVSPIVSPGCDVWAQPTDRCTVSARQRERVCAEYAQA